MEPSNIPDGVRELIIQHIASVAQLEVLLLAYDRRPATWDAAEVSRELRIDAGSAATILGDLAARGFLEPAPESPGRYRFAAAPQLHAILPELAAAYRERRVAVITLIFSKPPDPLRQFAEAFRLKKGSD
jgi:hypothetical protein